MSRSTHRRTRAFFAVSLLALAEPVLAEDGAYQVAPVTVVGQRDEAYRADRTVSATRTDTPVVDVPQALTVITDQLIRDQSMQSMADVVRYVPGVAMGQGEGHRDAPTLRGNASTADFYVDGLRDDVQYLRDLYNLSRVEVLKGPNAMIFGRGGGGGVINRVLKKADGSDDRSATLELGAYDHRRLTVDLAHVFDPDHSGRVSALYQRSESYRDFVNLERWGLTPSVLLRLSETASATLTYEHFEDDRTVDRGLPSFNGRPSRAPNDAFFGDPDRSHAQTNVDIVNLAVEFAISPNLKIRNRSLVGDYDKAYANIYPGGAAVAGPTGAPATFPLQAYINISPRENQFTQTDLVWTATAFGAEHTVLAGVELGRQRTSNLRETGRFGAANGPTTLGGLPFADPTRRGLPIIYSNAGSDAHNKVRVDAAAIYAQNQADFGLVQLITGLRYDRVDIDFTDLRTTAVGRLDFSRRDGMLSPRLGLVLKPAEPVSIYASYSISHLPASGDQFSSLTATSETLKPERFENHEIGLKWQPRPDLLVTAAAYRLTRDNTTAPAPSGLGVVQTGAQRTEGFEAGVSGRLSSRWEIAGGYAWQDAEITSITAAAPKGRKVPLVPRHTLSVWNRVEVSDRVGVGLGVIRQSRMFASISNAVILPGFTRVDAAVFLRLTDDLRAQVNFENLFDKRYFPTSHGDNNILPGAPRTVRVSLSADF